jgi:hypothetical protein
LESYLLLFFSLFELLHFSVIMASFVQHSEESLLENRTFEAQHGVSEKTDGFLSTLLAGKSTLSIAITILLVLVAYDQSKLPPQLLPAFFTLPL